MEQHPEQYLSIENVKEIIFNEWRENNPNIVGVQIDEFDNKPCITVLLDHEQDSVPCYQVFHGYRIIYQVDSIN